ncbi:hypothetical protein BDV30DRAFT_230136 [Aspergillus minisclerotigenes]|uniref:Amidoligase enzyme-domain-containing protein n=1 Tax=Aspergillus minisclerotigenes TaxID=656917 RepID=A0A5N6IUY7_9EURO|nr:hypothetical protein BDV30DRAFT_230136 [Aspergillus minisclerotigenes]
MSRKPAHPPPPPPPPPSMRASSKKPTNLAAPSYPTGSFGNGIEVEFLLSSRSTNSAKTIREFSRMVAASYNDYLARVASGQHPKMHNAIDEAYLGPQFAEWSLDSDSTIEMPNRGGAPSFPQVNANTSCGTHVHLSRVEGYSLADLKKICQSIIHFEPAFEALLPEDRLSNEYARSNWLDNANFGHRSLSRKQRIAAIQRSSSMRELMFGWNFLYLLNSPNGAIEFRRGAACSSAQQAFVYIEIAMSFIEAAIQLGSPENLERAPGTVDGLKQFISAARLSNNVPGLYDSRYLSLFFGNKTDGTFREPKPLGKLSAYQLNKLNKKKEDDKKNVAMVKMLHEPYWS